MATLQNILELAKRGSPKAIALLMNRHLQPKGITAKAGLRDGCLQVLLESATIPNQSTLVAFIRKGVTGLGTESIKRVRVYGKQSGKEFPAWIQEFELVTQTVTISPRLSSAVVTTPTTPTQNISAKVECTRKRGKVSTPYPQREPRQFSIQHPIQSRSLVPQREPLASSSLSPNWSPLDSSTPTKNLVVVRTKKTQSNQIVAEKIIKSKPKSIQKTIMKSYGFYNQLLKILGTAILFIVLLVIYLTIAKEKEIKASYKQADCEKTYRVVLNLIDRQKKDINKIPLDRKGVVAQANRIDKLVKDLNTEYIKLKDERLKLVVKQFVTEAQLESASLRRIASMEESKSKMVGSFTDEALERKIEFENERSMQSLLNQFSLIKDGTNYCKPK